MVPPSYASALTGNFLGVTPSPKRPREDEPPEVRRTAQSRACGRGLTATSPSTYALLWSL
eukprot:scaffold15177_cov129-Isochrysis_galbana.AAC.1